MVRLIQVGAPRQVVHDATSVVPASKRLFFIALHRAEYPESFVQTICWDIAHGIENHQYMEVIRVITGNPYPGKVNHPFGTIIFRTSVQEGAAMVHCTRVVDRPEECRYTSATTAIGQ